MIAYLDTSALVKRYVSELGSDLVSDVLNRADRLASAVVTRAELVAALAKAVRSGVMTARQALSCRQRALAEWQLYVVRLQITEPLMDSAARLAWNHALRGYDAVHLAAATAWRDTLGVPVTFVGFDLRLWSAASEEGMLVFPTNLPELLASWRASPPATS